jgi:arylsulfatase A-like enzyme
MPKELHQSFWCAEKAIDFIKRRKGKPWLFSVNPFDPHNPFDPPEEFFEKYDPDLLPSPQYSEGELDDKPVFQIADHKGHGGGRGLSFADTTVRQHREIIAAYYAMIENVDYNVGRLIDALEETGQRENTLIIYMSDHGEMLGNHGIFLKGPFLYDEAVRVPLIFSFPSRFKSGLKSDALVELVDVAPTLLDLCNMPIPGRMQGKSFLNICTGETSPDNHKSHVYAEYYNSLVNHRDPTPYQTMIRDKEFKIVAYSGMDMGELYDLREDPGEVKNLWNNSEYSEIRYEYLEKCLDASVFTIDPLPERVAEF